ncbi:MAG TPA: hypothetical protein VFW28_03130, partial [Micropepsaceae bacterium]|nr:hypothetical protein [Micropepsaceae bacterium]
MIEEFTRCRRPIPLLAPVMTAVFDILDIPVMRGGAHHKAGLHLAIGKSRDRRIRQRRLSSRTAADKPTSNDRMIPSTFFVAIIVVPG